MRIFLLENPTEPENWKEHNNKKSARHNQFAGSVLLISILITLILVSTQN